MASSRATLMNSPPAVEACSENRDELLRVARALIEGESAMLSRGEDASNPRRVNNL
jgi:hypothetical protein